MDYVLYLSNFFAIFYTYYKYISNKTFVRPGNLMHKAYFSCRVMPRRFFMEKGGMKQKKIVNYCPRPIQINILVPNSIQIVMKICDSKLKFLIFNFY